MSNITANAIDWYVDKLTKMRLVPLNLATLVRDVSSKQLSDGNFTPRPITIDNFSDAELDAMYRLADTKDGIRPITESRYGELGFDILQKKNKIDEYLSPMGVIRTTLGSAGVNRKGNDHVVTDVYDFNRDHSLVYKYFDHGDGTVTIGAFDKKGRPVRDQPTRVSKHDMMNVRKNEGAYGKLRTNAARFGHVDTDPDNQKIHVNVSLEQIKQRLGDKLGKHEVFKYKGGRRQFTMNAAAAGAMAGVPIGAALGAISGAMMLVNKKMRKHWVATMLCSIFGGAALAAAAGGAGGGALGYSTYNKFNNMNFGTEKKAQHKGDDAKKVKKRARNAARDLVKALAIAAPAAALGLGGLYAYGKIGDIRKKMLSDVYDPSNSKDSMILQRVKSLDELLSSYD